MLVSVMLLKPVVGFGYFLKISNGIAAQDVTEGEEDKSEESSLESCDEMIHSIPFNWAGNSGSVLVKKSTGVKINIEEHIREVVSPPPQA
jgi:hypothetical protein